MRRVAGPVVRHFGEGSLKDKMPVECPTGDAAKRRAVAHLEAVGRTLCGIAPWLELESRGPAEAALATEWADRVTRGLASMTDKASPDFLDFTAAGQNLVDAAFLALALIRAPRTLWMPLEAAAKERLIAAMQSTRRFKPPRNNWLLFAAAVEAWLASVGAEWRREPVEAALAAHAEWYHGDGVYGDGPDFHWDYYNSFVIQPMLLEVIERLGALEPRWAAMKDRVLARAVGYAAVQERLIGPDGSFPPLGRSLAYRGGAFHHLALMALRGQLPSGVKPGQVRAALAAVLQRTLDVPGTFDESGWLRVGLAGHQPGLGERYISTGSLYLCCAIFLPLGLPASHSFWAEPSTDWTARQIWQGRPAVADHAYRESAARPETKPKQ
ncbi:MAG: DUF2264 domain-containing protein [Verrucomicrobiota bacterium]|nr:DUF2264 domain-containing protein [Verrucomicrobiota bacterium]